jgi:hypothetical protein
MAIKSGVLSFTASGNKLGGTVNGAGMLQLQSGTDTFLAGLNLTVSNVVLHAMLTLGSGVTYAGNWTQNGGILTLGGNTLTLTGTANLDGGAINGGGAVTVGAGSTGEINTVQVNDSVVVNNSGNLAQGSFLTLGASANDTAKLNNAAGATYTIANNANINSNSNSTSLTNAGTLVKSGGGGTSSISVATINTGMIEIGSGGMSFLKPVSGSGTFQADADTSLTFRSSVAAGGKVTLGTDADLFLNGSFGDSIAGFAAGNIIETNLAFVGASLSFDPGLDKLTVTNGSSSIGLQLVGSYTASNFRLFSDAGLAAIAHT